MITKLQKLIPYIVILMFSLIFKEQLYEYVVCFIFEFFRTAYKPFQQIGFVIFYKDCVTLYCFLIISLLLMIVYYTIIYNNYKNSSILNITIFTFFVYLLNRIFIIEANKINGYYISIFDVFIFFNLCILAIIKIRTLDCFIRNDENVENKLIINIIDKDKQIDYEELANKTVSRIKKYRSKHAFIYTFLGKYGQGKTTLMNRIDHLLNEDAAIKRWYYPKKYMNEESAVEGLLNIFKEILSPYSSEIFDLIEGYSNALFQEKSSMLFDKINILKKINSFESQESIDNINNAIRRTGKTIIIFIDDMDRLQKEEIDVVFKLMRNISDFCNTVFVVAYDYDYIVEKTGYSQDYLEKYSNLTYSLPIKEDYTIEAYIYQQFKRVMENKDFEKVENFIKNPLSKPEEFESKAKLNLMDGKVNNQNFYDNISISQILKNHREVDAFLNSFMLSWDLITEGNKEFYYQEFFVYKLLLFKYPWINKVIEESIKRFFSINGLNTLFEEKEELRISELIIYQKLRKIKEEESKIINNDRKEDYNINNQYFDKLEKEEQESIDKIVEFLFDKNKGLEIEKKYSISKYIYYKMYSCDNSIGELKISEFKKAIENFKDGCLNKFFTKIKEIYKNDETNKTQISTEFFNLLLNYKEIPDTSIINYIETLFFIYNHQNSIDKSLITKNEIVNTILVYTQKFKDKKELLFELVKMIPNHIHIDSYGEIEKDLNDSLKLLIIYNFENTHTDNWFFTNFKIYVETSKYNIYHKLLYNYLSENEHSRVEIFKQGIEINKILFDAFLYSLQVSEDGNIDCENIFSFYINNKYEYNSKLSKFYKDNFIALIRENDFYKYEIENNRYFSKWKNFNFSDISFSEELIFNVNIFCLKLLLFADEEIFKYDIKDSRYLELFINQYKEYLEFLEDKKKQICSDKELENKINYIIDVVSLAKNNEVTKDKFIEILNKYENK